MAPETKPVTTPAWVAELKKQLAQPYTPGELARARKPVHAIRRRNAERLWSRGTFQRLLELAYTEDETEHGE